MPSFSRILVIKLKQPGDVLVSTPVLAALKEAWPQARVSYLVPKGTEGMVADHPGLSGLLVVDRRGETLSQTWRFIRELRRRRFDLVLELSGGDRGAFYTLLSGAKERLGFARPRKSFWQPYCFTKLFPRPPLKMHMVEANLEILRGLGLAPQNPRLQFFWPPQVEARIQELLASLNLAPGAFVVVHPGAGWLFKCWTPAGYARVIDALQGDWGLSVVLTASRALMERELLAAILTQTRVTPINLAGQLSLKELGALIFRARFFFGVDSAPMHLAAAVNTPAVALFGPSGDFNWRPWGQGHLVIKKDWDCVPCGIDGCEGSKISRCLTELTAEEVLERIEEHFGLGGGLGERSSPSLRQNNHFPTAHQREETMARVVGDKLIVNVARKPGEEQIIDLTQLFNQNPNKIIVVAGTVGADGAPNTAPLSLIFAKDEKTLLVATLRNTTTATNLRRDGRVCLEIIRGEDLVMGIFGTMRLIKEPMAFSEAMALWEMRVEKVKQDTSPAQRVIQGPASVPRSEKAEAFEKAAFAELAAAAQT